MADTPSIDGPSLAELARDDRPLIGIIGDFLEADARDDISRGDPAGVLTTLILAAGFSRMGVSELESVRAERDTLADRVDMAAWDELTAERDGYMSEASDERERADRLAATIARVGALAAESAGYPEYVTTDALLAALADPAPGDRNFSELTGHPGHPAIAEPFFCTVCGTGATHIQNGTCRDCDTDPVRRRIQALDEAT